MGLKRNRHIDPREQLIGALSFVVEGRASSECLARGMSVAVNSDADTAFALVAHQIRIMKPRRATANRAGHLLAVRP
jgi:hypothetical protein